MIVNVQDESWKYLGGKVHDSVNVLALKDVSHEVEGLDASLHELEVGLVHHGFQVVGGGAVVCMRHRL